MKKFAPYFSAEKGGALVPELKEAYGKIREEFPDLPDARSKPAMTKALRDYEEEHIEQCELLDEPNQFYGWSQGKNLLDKYVQCGTCQPV